MKKPLAQSKGLIDFQPEKIKSEDYFERNRIFDIGVPNSKAGNVTLEEILLEKVNVGESDFPLIKMNTVLIDHCNFLNTKCEGGYLDKVEVISSRFTTFQLVNGNLRDVVFKDSKIDSASFRLSKFKNVLFQRCTFTEGDMYGGILNDVIFRDCDLTNLQLSAAKLKNVDFRGSNITGIKINRDSFE